MNNMNIGGTEMGEEDELEDSDDDGQYFTLTFVLDICFVYLPTFQKWFAICMVST